MREAGTASPALPFGMAPDRSTTSLASPGASTTRSRGLAVSNLGAAVTLGLLGFVLVWTRLIAMPSGFWNDEAYSAYNYIDGGPRAIFLGPYVPNNHVLFSLLAWLTRRALGGTEPVYRLWSVVPALAAVAALAGWAWRRLGPWVAVAIAFVLTTSPMHLELATQARGYGLGFLAAALLPIAATRASDGDRRARAFPLLAAAGALGIFTLPVFALPFLGQAAALALVPGCLRGALAAVGVVGAASLAFYAPLLGQIVETSRQEFGAPLAWEALLTGPCRDLLCPTLPALGADLAAPVALAIFWVLIACGALRLLRRGEGALLAHLSAPVIATYAGLALLRLGVVPRFLSYLLPPLAVLAALGLVEVVAPFARGRIGKALVAVVVAFGAAAGLVRFHRLALYGALTPIESYREAVAVAKGTGIPTVVTNSRFGLGFLYYARWSPIAFPTREELEHLFCESTEPFVYIDYPLYGEPVDRTCLESRKAVAIRIAQRAGGPEGEMTVYVLRP